MALGSVPGQARFENPREVLGDRLVGLYLFLAVEGGRLFGDDYFADLYMRSRLGRPTVPARVLATVMVLQAFEGLSDREACDRLERDLAWQAACGVDVGHEAFHATVLVGVRNRLRASDRAKRFLDDTRVMARESGVMRNRVRVLDSTPIYDAVTTEDTITQLRAAIRKMLTVLRHDYPVLAVAAKAACVRDDDYSTPGRPPCDWDDRAAKDALVDGLVRDARAVLSVLDGEILAGAACDAAELLAVVAGQDVVEGDDGRFRIARAVARDRVISTVDPQARHGHKSRSRRFDGYKGHVSVDPDSEIIDDVTVTPANTADQDAVDELLGITDDENNDENNDENDNDESEAKPVVMGDSAYAGAELRERLDGHGYKVHAKVPPASNRDGLFTKDDFTIICAPARCGVRPIGIPRSAVTLTGPAPPSSVTCAGVARYVNDARPQRRAARSASAVTKPACSKRRRNRPTRPGRPRTAQPARKSNARSAISHGAFTADAKPDVVAPPAS